MGQSTDKMKNELRTLRREIGLYEPQRGGFAFSLPVSSPSELYSWAKWFKQNGVKCWIKEIARNVKQDSERKKTFYILWREGIEAIESSGAMFAE